MRSPLIDVMLNEPFLSRSQSWTLAFLGQHLIEVFFCFFFHFEVSQLSIYSHCCNYCIVITTIIWNYSHHYQDHWSFLCSFFSCRSFCVVPIVTTNFSLLSSPASSLSSPFNCAISWLCAQVAVHEEVHRWRHSVGGCWRCPTQWVGRQNGWLGE